MGRGMYTRGRMEGKEGWVRDVYEGKEGRKDRKEG